MPDEPSVIEKHLRHALGRFLGTRDNYALECGTFLRDVHRLGHGAYLFGGTLRDLALRNRGVFPRDLDVVVADLTPELLSFLEPNIVGKTRFGGLKLKTETWQVDIWALKDTWAFRENVGLAADFASLTKTTFLDIQAIAAEVVARPGKGRRFFSSGFYGALATKTIDLNFEDNPYPTLCVLSALLHANRFDYALGSKLVRYIIRYRRSCEMEELELAQRHHYGKVLYTRDTLHQWLDHIESEHRRSASEPLRIPRVRHDQLSLFRSDSSSHNTFSWLLKSTCPTQLGL
jgi:hypothetical protein